MHVVRHQAIGPYRYASVIFRSTQEFEIVFVITLVIGIASFLLASVLEEYPFLMHKGEIDYNLKIS